MQECQNYFDIYFQRKNTTTQNRENNLNNICDMAKVRDLRDFYKTGTPQFQNALRMRLANTLLYMEQNLRGRNLGKNILNIPL